MDIATIISIISALAVILGGLINFFVLQVKQNNAIAQNTKTIEELNEKIQKQTRFHIKTEKDIIVIKTKMKIPID